MAKRTQLELAKIVKLSELKTYFAEISARPVINTGYGFSVQAGYSDLTDFEVGLDLGLLTIRSADNSNHTVTSEQFADIINQIKQNGVRLKSTKWAVEGEINEAQSVESLDDINFDERFEASELTPSQILSNERNKLINQLEVDLQENAIDIASAVAEDGVNEDNNVDALRTERTVIKNEFQTSMVELITGAN